MSLIAKLSDMRMVMCLPEIPIKLRQRMKSEQDIKCQIENLKICLKTLEEKQKRLAKREQKWQKDVVEWREIHKNHPGKSCKELQ